MHAAHLPKVLALDRSDHDQLFAQIQYLTIENQILRSKLPKRVSRTPKERRRLIRFGKAVGYELRHLISIVQFSTFQKWLRTPKNKKPKKRAIPRRCPKTAETAPFRDAVSNAFSSNGERFKIWQAVSRFAARICGLIPLNRRLVSNWV